MIHIHILYVYVSLSLYIYTYIDVYVYIYIYIYTHTYTYIYIHIHICSVLQHRGVLTVREGARDAVALVQTGTLKYYYHHYHYHYHYCYHSSYYYCYCYYYYYHYHGPVRLLTTLQAVIGSLHKVCPEPLHPMLLPSNAARRHHRCPL